MWGLRNRREPFVEETSISKLSAISINFLRLYEDNFLNPMNPFKRCSKEFAAWMKASQECLSVFPVDIAEFHSGAKIILKNVQTIHFLDWLILLPNSKTSYQFLIWLREALDSLNRVKLSWQYWTFMMKPTGEIVVFPFLRFSAGLGYSLGLENIVRCTTKFPFSKKVRSHSVEEINQEAYDYVETCVKNKWSIVALLGVKRRRPPQLARFDKFLIREIAKEMWELAKLKMKIKF